MGGSTWGEPSRRWSSWAAAAAEVVPARIFRRDQCWRSMRPETAARSRQAGAVAVVLCEHEFGVIGVGRRGREGLA